VAQWVLRPLLLLPLLIFAPVSEVHAIPRLGKAGPRPAVRRLLQAPAATTYPNTEDGLRQLLQDVCAAAKSGDEKKVAEFVKDMEIPNYEIWFTTTFGQDRGESWAEPYGAKMAKNNLAIVEVFGRMAQENGEFIVHKLNEKEMYGAQTPPIDIYFADWKAASVPIDSKGEPIGRFVFIDGNFRWDSTSWFPSSRLWFPNGKKTITGKLVPAKLVKKVDPIYPTEAATEHISGTVRVYFVIGADGAVYNAHALSGKGLSSDPILGRAAEQAVLQWRYQPATLNGKRVQVNAVTVDIVFSPLS
jgi:TonB family protein